MSYWQLLLKHPRTLFFGFLTSFFSGLGQTHFVALFSPVIMVQYGLSHSDYGSLYSLMTLLSGVFINFLGPTIDRYDIRWVSLVVGLGMVFSQALLFTEQSLILVGLGLFGLRLLGQGMCPSIGSIAIARYFTQNRGKALSLSSMGFPLFEGVMTPIFALILFHFNFKVVSIILMISLLVIFIPLTFTLTRFIPDFNKQNFNEDKANTPIKEEQKSWTRKEVFFDKTIYLILPQALISPFALTGIFFHQAILANTKSLSLTLMATGLSFFAVGRILNSFVTGPQVDRYTAVKLFPFYQIPMALGFLVLAFFNEFWVVGLSYFLFGLTVGAGSTVKSAIWAELYGVRHLGAIKSTLATVIVFSTSISPALFGIYFDFYQDAFFLLFGLFILTLMASALSFWVLKSKNQFFSTQ